jgi:hypothetical protein
MSVTAVPLRPIAKGSVAKLWIGLLVLALAAAAFAWWGTAALQWTTTASGLQYKVVKDGQGATAGDSDFVFIDYVGRLQTPLPASSPPCSRRGPAPSFPASPRGST